MASEASAVSLKGCAAQSTVCEVGGLGFQSVRFRLDGECLGGLSCMNASQVQCRRLGSSG
eukprot:3266837-Amphidinium_carterae.1